MTDLWLGVDVGTTAIKAAAYDSHGRIAALAECPNEVLRPAPGFAEQDMDAVWRGVAACLRELAEKCAGKRFRSLGLCGQGDGFWPVDADGRPTHNAMLWNDTRAAADVEALIASGAADAVGHGCTPRCG
ncbi:MAG: carbohydrate kinase, partial [Aquamicrobium sp.]|nr:carbohydrate kinase [Aquamicrobium sp.]